MRILVGLVTVAACSASSPCDDYAWHIELSRPGDVHEGAEGVLTVHPDGSLFLVINEFDEVRFGDRDVRGRQLARIGIDGAVLSVTSVEPPGFSRSFGIGLAGSEAVIGWDSGPEVTITAYDADLATRWSVTRPNEGSRPAFAAATDGTAALHTSTMFPTKATIEVLDRDGGVRWTTPQEAISRLAFAANGDLLELGYANGRRHLRRRAAADGALLEDRALEGSIGIEDQLDLRSDGSVVIASGPIVTRYGSDGAVRWSRTIELRHDPQLAASTTGDVIVDGGEVLVLDADTGETRISAPSCGYFRIAAADETGYYGVGLPGSTSVGVARYGF